MMTDNHPPLFPSLPHPIAPQYPHPFAFSSFFSSTAVFARHLNSSIHPSVPPLRTAPAIWLIITLLPVTVIIALAPQGTTCAPLYRTHSDPRREVNSS